jgi:hypothetical protein
LPVSQVELMRYSIVHDSVVVATYLLVKQRRQVRSASLRRSAQPDLRWTNIPRDGYG